ncbi:MAG: hypothetical protein ACRBN8_15975 [Nannocystales bacterium]
MTWSRMSLIGLVLTGACVGESAVSFEGVLEEHRTEVSGDILDCGHATVGNECRESMSEAEACIVDAFTRCTAAELRLDVTGTDAAFDVALFVDVAPDGTCTVSRFTDHSADGFKGDYGDYVEQGCAGLAAVVPDTEAGVCAGVTATECATREEWYE